MTTNHALWHDSGTWIALGVSAFFLLAAWVLHRVFVRVLKSPPIGSDAADPAAEPLQASPQQAVSAESPPSAGPLP